MSVFAWLAATVAFVVLEIATTNIVSIWFAIGAFVATGVAWISPDAMFLQIAVFLGVTAVTMYFTRPALTKVLHRKTATNADMLIGDTAVVIADIAPDFPGRAKAGGLNWMAKSESHIKAGEMCKIVKLEGAAIVVEKITVNE